MHERARCTYAGRGWISYSALSTFLEEGRGNRSLVVRVAESLREERVENGRRYLVLGDGTRFWTTSPEATAVQDGVGWTLVNPSTRVLLDPSALLPLLDFEVGGACHQCRAEAIVRSRYVARYASFDVPLLIGATEHQLLVDAERGRPAARRVAAGGLAFDTIEVTDAAFDEPLDAALYSYERRRRGRSRPQDVSPGELVTVEEAAARASFTVLVRDRSDAGGIRT